MASLMQFFPDGFDVALHPRRAPEAGSIPPHGDDLAPNLEEAERFLTLLDEGAEQFTFQTFADATGNGSLSRIIHGALDDVWPRLVQLNRQGAGIYVTVNATDGRGRGIANIVRSRAVWRERDGKHENEKKSLPLDPQVIVNSSPGKYHDWIFVDGLFQAQHEGVMERLTADYGNDPNAKDFARVLRLPGLCNRKYADPFRVRIVAESGAQSYSALEVLTALPPIDRSGSSRKANGANSSGAASGETLIEARLRALRTGENLHGSLRDIAARWVTKKLDPVEIQEALTALAGCSKAAVDRPDDLRRRVQQIPQLIATAREKFSKWDEPIDPWQRLAVSGGDLEGTVPDVIKRFATSEGERLAVDPVAIAGFCLGVCAAALSDDWRVQMKTKDTRWTQQARLWVAGIQMTGSRKDDQLKAAVAPLYALEEAWRADHQEAVKKWEADDEDERGPKPPCRRVIINSATVAKLSDLLDEKKKHARTTKLLSVHQELAGWFGAMDAFSSGRKQSEDRPYWLRAYDGGPEKIDRVNRGELYVSNWSVGVVGAIQPQVMVAAIKTLQDEGLPQRFIMLVPEPVETGADFDDDIAPDQGAVDGYHGLVKALSILEPPRTKVGALDRAVLVAEAQDARRDLARWVRQVGNATPLPSHLRNAAPKWEGLHARLTLLYHCIELAERKSGAVTWLDKAAIGREAAEQAAAFIRRIVWPHAQRFYMDVLGLSGEGVDDAQRIAGHILAHADRYQEKRHIARRDLQMLTPFKGAPRERVSRAMETLEDWGWTRPTEKATRWDLNPVLWQRFGERAAQEKQRRAETVALIREAAGK